jgi:hypothetical protein
LAAFDAGPPTLQIRGEEPMSDASIPILPLAVESAARDRDSLGAGVVILSLMFLGVAFWNGFPLMFYDTGAYLAEGISHIFLAERSPVYSLLLLFTGGAFSLWPVVILQALMSAYLIVLIARIEAPGVSLRGITLIGACLMGLTGIGWYVGQVEPDCMTSLLMLGSYLLLFRNDALDQPARYLVITITALAVASHPSHLGLIGGLLILGVALRGLAHFLPDLPRPNLKFAAIALALSLALTLTSNFALARAVFISRSGPVFVFARLMQDGIVKRLLDDTCPQSGYYLCPYRDRLPHNANAWLWGDNILFHREGGFANSQAEDQRMIVASLKRYPLMHVKAALYDSVLQFFMFRTGDGIESQARILRPEFTRDLPSQLPAYLRARQQRQRIPFQDLNMIHVTVGMLSLLGVALLLYQALSRRRWDGAMLPGLVLAGLVGNAIICGTFSNPHDRYQSRVMWLPALVLLLARTRDPHALEPTEGSE